MSNRHKTVNPPSEDGNSNAPSQDGNLDETKILKLLLNLLKIKHLWNHNQIQLNLYNKTHCKSKILLTLIHLLKKKSIPRMATIGF